MVPARSCALSMLSVREVRENMLARRVIGVLLLDRAVQRMQVG